MKRIVVMFTAALMVSVSGLAPAQESFTETFDTKALQEYSNADWDTIAGHLTHHPFEYSLLGDAPTPDGRARGLAVVGGLVYVADGYSGLQVIDVSNPNSPSIIGAYNTPGYAYHVKVAGDYAYVADHSSGINVINVAYPSTPVSVAVVPTGTAAVDLAISGNTLFVGAGPVGLMAVDITDPFFPVAIDTLDTAGNAARGLSISGDALFLADGNTGVHVVDVSDPASMELVTTYDTPSYAFDVEVSGDFAYVSDRGAGFLILDISDPSMPLPAGSDAYGGYSQSLDVVGTRAYLTDNDGGLRIYDITDPTTPLLLDTVATTGHTYDVKAAGNMIYVADYGSGLQIIQAATPIGSIVPGALAPLAEHVVTDGDRLFVAASGTGLEIYDIADPLSPTQLGSLASTTTARGIAVSGNHAFLTHTSPFEMQVIDISDPVLPVQVGNLLTAGRVQDLIIDGNHAYLANASAGLQVVDISDPTAPFMAGSLPTGPGAYHLAIDGNLALVTGTFGSIWLIDISNPALPALYMSFTPPAPAANAEIVGGRAYVAGTSAGVFTYDISDPYAPLLMSTTPVSDSAQDIQVRGGRVYVGTDDGLTLMNLWSPDSPSTSGQVDKPGGCRVMAVQGQYVYGGRSSFGLQVIKTMQDDVDLGAIEAFSKTVHTSSDPVIRVRVTPRMSGSAEWYVFGSQGEDTYVLPNEWTPLIAGTPTLKWLGLLAYTPGTQTVVEDLTLEWLYDAPRIESIVDIPNDQGRQISLEWSRSGHDFTGDATQVVEYAVYRRIDPGLGAKAAPVVEVKGADPALRQNIETMAAAGWHYLSSVPVLVEDRYAVVAPTLADSTLSDGLSLSTFKVVALTATPGVFFTSPPDSGYSIDNLAPGIPTMVSASYQAGQVALDWDDAPDADFRYFRIYRSADPDFVPHPGNLLSVTSASDWIDTATDAWSQHYKITAVDFAGNESPAGEVSNASAAPDASATRFVLHGAMPNPFNPTTELSFELPTKSRARLTVYDVSGREIAVLVDEVREAGRHVQRWDGRDRSGNRVASGVYLYQLQAGSQVQMKRMVLLK